MSFLDHADSLKFYVRIVVGFIRLFSYGFRVLCPLMISEFCVLLGKAFLSLKNYIFKIFFLILPFQKNL